MKRILVSFSSFAAAVVASAATLSYTPQGSAPYYWDNAAAWGGTAPTSSDNVKVGNAMLLSSPLVVQSGTSAAGAKVCLGDGVLQVENGASLALSSGLLTLADKDQTSIVTNYGMASTIQKLDMGIYGDAGIGIIKDSGGSGKGKLAQFDNFGNLTIGTHLRMGILGTPSVFYNHEGATVTKGGTGDYTFYLGANTQYSVCTLISEGNFTFSGSPMRIAAKDKTTNHVVLAKSGTFTANGYMRVGEQGYSYNTLTMKDESLLTGSGGFAAPYGASNAEKAQAYVTLSNNAAIVKSSGIFVIGGQKNGIGVMTLNDNSRVDLPDVLYVGAQTAGARGQVEVHDNASLSARNYIYVGGSVSSTTGELVVTDSAHVTNGVICVGCHTNGLGTATFSGQSHLECTGNGYIAHGKDTDYTSTGHMMFKDSATAVFGNYLHIASGRQGNGSLTIKDNASVSVLHRELSVGEARDTVASLTVADNARLLVSKIDPERAATNLLAVAGKWLSTGYVTVTNSGFVFAQSITVAEGSSSKGTFNLAGGCVVASNITISTGSSSAGEFVVGDCAVVSNVFNIQIGASYAANAADGKGGLLKMRGGTMLFNIGHSKNSTVIYLNPLRDTTAGAIRGWGKLAFTDPIAMVKNMDSENPEDYEKPGGITHYGPIIADGEGQMRDLDFGRLGVLTYQTTDANNNGSTNGWYAVNKGRLKLPRSLPRKSSSHRCVGDYWALNTNKNPATRLANTFLYTMVGAELNNYMFSELYATDRDDIPAGLDAIGADRTLAVWRIGHFSDGPEIDEPTHPAAFTSASLRFRYSTNSNLLDGLTVLRVYRHDGTANGRWKCVGRAEPSTSNPVISATVDAPSEANWNMGWFAIVGRVNPFGTSIIFR